MSKPLILYFIFIFVFIFIYYIFKMYTVQYNKCTEHCDMKKDNFILNKIV
jgi:hypothetical protein